jgi:hypothetical protein
VIAGKVLDPSAALAVAAGRTQYAHALLRTSLNIGIVLVLPAAALAEAWARADPADRPLLEEFAEHLAVVVVEPLTASDAGPVGLLRRAAGDAAADLGTAQAVHVGLQRGWPVVTAVPDLVRALDPGVAVDELP